MDIKDIASTISGFRKRNFLLTKASRISITVRSDRKSAIDRNSIADIFNLRNVDTYTLAAKYGPAEDKHRTVPGTLKSFFTPLSPLNPSTRFLKKENLRKFTEDYQKGYLKYFTTRHVGRSGRNLKSHIKPIWSQQRFVSTSKERWIASASNHYVFCTR